MSESTVAAIVARIDADTPEVLLALREHDPFKDHWCLPGGHIDPFERASDAISREVLEETGLTFEGRFLGYQDEIIPEQQIHAVVLIFVGTATGDLLAAQGEIREVRWFSLDEARNLMLAFKHNAILDAYAAAMGASGE